MEAAGAIAFPVHLTEGRVKLRTGAALHVSHPLGRWLGGAGRGPSVRSPLAAPEPDTERVLGAGGNILNFNGQVDQGRNPLSPLLRRSVFSAAERVQGTL